MCNSFITFIAAGPGAVLPLTLIADGGTILGGVFIGGKGC
jgi:hypothetical protein